jgi:hypothetical protein
MDMETSLACSSAATAAALFAVSLFSLSTLPRVSVCRRSTSAAHAAFVQPGGLSFGAHGFLSFGMPSSEIFFGGMVVEEKRRSYNCEGIRRGKRVYVVHFEGKRNKWRGTTLYVADTTGPLNVSRIFVSSGVPERPSESRGWPGLSGWMKDQIRAKTRNRVRDWTE